METLSKIGRVNVQEPTPKLREDKFQNTIAFIETAFAEGAHLKLPEGTKQKKRWERDVDITVVYLLNPDETLEDVGKIFGGITRGRIKQIKDKTMNTLWLNCSSETQTLFPLNELDLEKPLTQKSRERMSRSRGGISIFIRDHVASGKSVKQIRKEGRYSKQQLISARKTLKRWGVRDLGYVIIPASQNLDLEENLKKAATDQEKQKFLNQVKLNFYARDRRRNDPLLMSIRNIFKKAGFNEGHLSQNFAVLLASLKDAGLPIGELQKKAKKEEKEIFQRYYFTLAKDKERAIQILFADPNLQRFRRS